MRAEDLKPGMKVRCVRARYGTAVPDMLGLIGKVVTIRSVVGVLSHKRVEIEEGKLSNCAMYYLWSPDDFEPLDHIEITEPTDEEYIYILGV